MIATIKLINIPITSHSNQFFCMFVVRTLEIYTQQISGIELLTIITVLYITSSGLIHLITEKFVPSDQQLLFSPTLQSQ